YITRSKLQFSKTTSITSKIDCLNLKYFLVDNSTLDIQCDLPEAIETVIITGTGQTSLCSLYINGGRNVALKQRARQTSTLSNSTLFDASNGIDGNTNSTVGVGSCTHTEQELKPMWTVTFPLSEITRYVIYNRGDRLTSFLIL
ncbi:cell death abnormality protein 1, partial [Biomphalaria pfeifferi]